MHKNRNYDPVGLLLAEEGLFGLPLAKEELFGLPQSKKDFSANSWPKSPSSVNTDSTILENSY